MCDLISLYPYAYFKTALNSLKSFCLGTALHNWDGGCASLCAMALADGREGNLHWTMHPAREKHATMANMPVQPRTGLSTWVRTAVTGADAACPLITRP